MGFLVSLRLPGCFLIRMKQLNNAQVGKPEEGRTVSLLAWADAARWSLPAILVVSRHIDRAAGLVPADGAVGCPGDELQRNERDAVAQFGGRGRLRRCPLTLATL